MRSIPPLALAFAAACSGPSRPAAESPAPAQVGTEVTCCITHAADGSATREIVPVERCADEQRNPVDACEAGPGGNEPTP
jgi:hypothetical protein